MLFLLRFFVVIEDLKKFRRVIRNDVDMFWVICEGWKG